MGLTDDLGPGPTALDTAVFICFIEESPDFLSLVAPIFEAVAAGRRQVVTSSLTLPEVLRDLPPVPGLRILQLREYV